MYHYDPTRKVGPVVNLSTTFKNDSSIILNSGVYKFRSCMGENQES